MPNACGCGPKCDIYVEEDSNFRKQMNADYDKKLDKHGAGCICVRCRDRAKCRAVRPLTPVGYAHAHLAFTECPRCERVRTPARVFCDGCGYGPP